jgi:hypothetical protein
MSKAVTANKKPRIVKKIQHIFYDPSDSRRVALIHEQRIEKNLNGTKVSKRIIRTNTDSAKRLEDYIEKEMNQLFIPS